MTDWTFDAETLTHWGAQFGEAYAAALAEAPELRDDHAAPQMDPYLSGKACLAVVRVILEAVFSAPVELEDYGPAEIDSNGLADLRR